MLLEIPLFEYAERLRIAVGDTGKRQVYDPIRRQWVAMLPEEMVRQLWIQHLTERVGYPSGRMRVEYGLVVHAMQKRCDVLIFDGALKPWLLLECKAPQVPITTKVFEQIAVYNIPLQVPYLVVSNGVTTYSCRLDYEANNYVFLEALPEYK